MTSEQVTTAPEPHRIDVSTFGTPTPGDVAHATYVEHRRHVHVSYDRHGAIQIGIDLTLEELRDALATATAQAAAAAASTPEGFEYSTGHHLYRVTSDVLDRAEMNRGIHILRRARDTVFGRDA